MDRSRVSTTLEHYAAGGELAQNVRDDAAAALKDLADEPHFGEYVSQICRRFLAASVQRSPGLAPDAEIIKWAFRAGLETGLSIGAVGEPDWGV